MHIATERVENSAQVLFCWLKFIPPPPKLGCWKKIRIQEVGINHWREWKLNTRRQRCDHILKQHESSFHDFCGKKKITVNKQDK
jgi:hypothetical protein